MGTIRMELAFKSQEDYNNFNFIVLIKMDHRYFGLALARVAMNLVFRDKINFVRGFAFKRIGFIIISHFEESFLLVVSNNSENN